MHLILTAAAWGRNLSDPFYSQETCWGAVFLLEVTHPLRSHFTGVRMVYIENVMIYAVSIKCDHIRTFCSFWWVGILSLQMRGGQLKNGRGLAYSFRVNRGAQDLELFYQVRGSKFFMNKTAFFFFGLSLAGCRILVPQPGIEPRPMASESADS